MGSAIQQIGSGVQNAWDSANNASVSAGRGITNATGIGGDLGYLINSDPRKTIDRGLNGITGGGGGDGSESHQASPNFVNMHTPQQPTNPMQELQKSQLEQQKQFQSNIPSMQKQMSDQLKTQYNSQLQSNLKTVKSQNSMRGLGYGGLSQGQQASETGREQAGLATGLGNINTGLENANQQMQANALQTGVGIQNTNQQIQNQLYQQELGKMQANNSMSGSIMGTIGTLGLLAALA